MFQEKYLDWYREAIRLDLRLSGLYEAYMLSMPDNSTEELPQMVTMYFRYSCNLPYQKKALFMPISFRKDARHRGFMSSICATSKLFMIEQMKANRMNDNLAIIYQNVLEMGVVDEEMAHLISGMVFMKNWSAFIRTSPVHLSIRSSMKCRRDPGTRPSGMYSNPAGTVPVTARDGEWHPDQRSQGIHPTKAYVPGAFYQEAGTLVTAFPSFYPCGFCGEKEAEDYTLDDVKTHAGIFGFFAGFKRYKQEKYSAFIGFLQDHCREEVLEEHFAKHVDFGQLDARTRGFVISLFIQRQDYERAYALMQDYYGLQVDDRLLLQMCTERLLTTEFAEDEFLLAVCGYVL